MTPTRYVFAIEITPLRNARNTVEWEVSCEGQTVGRGIEPTYEDARTAAEKCAHEKAQQRWNREQARVQRYEYAVEVGP